MSKKKKQRKIVRDAVRMSPRLSDKQILDIQTSEESGRDRPKSCANCGSHTSNLKKNGKEFWCVSCMKGEKEVEKSE